MPTATPTLTPTPPSGSSRDKFRQPFASTSIWNQPIGSGAVYVPANIHTATGAAVFNDPDILLLNPNAPLTNVVLNTDDWSGRSRCAAQGGTVFSAPFPPGYIIPGASVGYTPNSATAFILADGRTLVQTQPVAHCTASGPVTTHYQEPSIDIYGPGITGAHGGSHLSSIGGTIRLGELLTGIPHAIKVNLDCDVDCSPTTGGFRWPAINSDCNSACGYNGQTSAVKMGSLLAILPSVDCQTFVSTVPGRLLCHAMQDYGAYVVDSSSWSAHGIETEESPNGSVAGEFQQAYGVAFQQFGTGTSWAQDVAKLFGALAVIDNNSPASIGGDGAPRVPLAPPIGN